MYLSCLHFEMNKIYTYGSLDAFMLHLLHEEVLQNVYNSLANILSISTLINTIQEIVHVRKKYVNPNSNSRKISNKYLLFHVILYQFNPYSGRASTLSSKIIWLYNRKISKVH